MASETEILMTIIAGTSVIFGLALSIVLFVVMYNRKLKAKETAYELELINKEMEVLRAVIDTQETERDKIARNLHDEVGPMITSLKLKLTKHQRDLEKEKLQPDALEEEKKLTDMLIENIRSVSHDLSPQFLRKQGLIKALKSYMNNLEGLESTVNIEFIDDDFDAHVSLNVYRIVLELVNNVLKHENATKLHLNIKKLHEDMLIQIEHDGEGISNKEFTSFAQSGTGMGLDSLKSRTIVIGAQLDYRVKPAVITLNVPLNGKKD